MSQWPWVACSRMLALEQSLAKVWHHYRWMSWPQGKLSRRRKLWEEGREQEPGSGTSPSQGPAQAAWHVPGEPKVDPQVDPCTWSPETEFYARGTGERGLKQAGPSKPSKDFWKWPKCLTGECSAHLEETCRHGTAERYPNSMPSIITPCKSLRIYIKVTRKPRIINTEFNLQSSDLIAKSYFF